MNELRVVLPGMPNPAGDADLDIKDIYRRKYGTDFVILFTADNENRARAADSIFALANSIKAERVILFSICLGLDLAIYIKRELSSRLGMDCVKLISAYPYWGSDTVKIPNFEESLEQIEASLPATWCDSEITPEYFAKLKRHALKSFSELFGSEENFKEMIDLVDYFIISSDDSVIDNSRVCLPASKLAHTTCDHAKHGVDYMEKLTAALATI